MFSLTVLDCIRLDPEHVAQNYMVHARAADRYATFAFAARLTMAAILALGAASAIAELMFTARYYQIVAAATTAVATLAFSLYCVLGFEARVAAHRSFAHRLWLVAERYRSLLAEADEGFLDRVTLLERRDQLIEQVHAIYERGFGVDQRAFESERLPAIKPGRAA